MYYLFYIIYNIQTDWMIANCILLDMPKYWILLLLPLLHNLIKQKNIEKMAHFCIYCIYIILLYYYRCIVFNINIIIFFIFFFFCFFFSIYIQIYAKWWWWWLFTCILIYIYISTFPFTFSNSVFILYALYLHTLYTINIRKYVWIFYIYI